MKKAMIRILVSELVVGAALIAVLAWASLTSAKLPTRGPATQGASVEVKIENFSFTPREITVGRGTKVTWVNRDDTAHTVRSTEDKFKSKALDTDDTFSFTFDTPGTYEYFCSVHPKMTAKIIVK